MAENKKSFILYCDLLQTVGRLPDETAGKLLKIILEYVNDKNPVVEDLLLQIAFEPIKQQLKRDLKDWEEIKGERSNSGKIGNLKRWNKDLYKKFMSHDISLEEAQEIAKGRTAILANRPVSQSIANIAVTDTVTVTVTDINNSMWTSIKKNFLEDGPWQFKFVTEKKISLETLDEKMKEFISDIELKEDFKELKDLKNHFTNWFNKKEKTLLRVDFKNNNHHSGPPLKRASDV